PPTPVTLSERGAALETHGPWPATRVSSSRAGVIPTSPPAAGAGSGVVYQPTTSTTTWVQATLVAMLMLPPVPTLTTTRLGMVWPATKLRLAVNGCATPAG